MVDQSDSQSRIGLGIGHQRTDRGDYRRDRWFGQRHNSRRLAARRIRGGSNNDTIYGGGGDDILLGGDGADVIYGESGFDVVIGGVGADRLSGGFDDDLLFGGTTSFDAQDAALDAILNEWSRSDLPASTSYSTRVANLRAGLVGIRGLKLDATTVQNDSLVDVLLGDDGQDWFWANLAVIKVDPRTGKELLN
ncbi:MAG: hypothetical protein U0794_02220 [Isosphaeraceae bacterium]